MKTLTIYRLNRWKYEAVVAAQTQKEAARAFGTTLYDLRKWRSIVPDIDVALQNPGVVFRRDYLGQDGRRNDGGWQQVARQ